MDAGGLVLNAQRPEAFDALKEVVDDARRQGRSTYAASIKPRLKVRFPAFDEGALGYVSFRAFLVDAEREGHVRLVLTKGGDVEVSLPGEPPREAGRVRRDFWKATTDYEGVGRYFYDPPKDQVVSRSAGDGVESGVLVEIPIADEATQQGWINKFVTAVPERAGLAKQIAATEELSDRLQLLNRNVTHAKDWHRERLELVLRLLMEWASQHSLNVDFADRTRRQPSTDRTQRRPSPHMSVEQRLRERVHRAIDRMPASDLLRLPIPLEYTVEL